MSSINKNKYLSLTEKSFYKKLGKVTKIVGLTIESVGPDAKLNDLCRIYSADNSQELYAEVVGFNDSNVLLMPYDVVDGIGPGMRGSAGGLHHHPPHPPERCGPALHPPAQLRR